MFMTNRQIMSLLIIVLSGFVLWIIPTQVRGDNQLFGANGTLLPALAIGLMLVLSLLDFILSMLSTSRSDKDRQLARANDVSIKKPQAFGIGLVVVLMVLFVWLLPVFGYLAVSTALLVGLMLGVGGRGRPIVIILTSIIAVGVLFLALRYGLGLRLQIWPNLTLWTG